ncbi:MAG: hypothetical protein K1X79_07215 [Oligoflexia bacterium]|nr:hypothetical protein [Oligoflexia bacterium]
MFSLFKSTPGRSTKRLTPAAVLTPWSLGLRRGPTLEALSLNPEHERPILTHRDVTDCEATFVADPFAWHRDGRWYLFFETFDRVRGRGVISCATSTDTVKWNYERVVLHEPFHLSYPYVFEFNGNMYMLPEGRKGGAVRLYRAVEFPYSWALVGNLIEGKYKDCSIVEWQGRWWMFAGMGAYGLRIFHAETPLGPWVPQRKPWVYLRRKSRARPGGRVISYDGKLLRFGQDNRVRYGHQLRALVVDELDSRRFREHELSDKPILAPADGGWNSVGMHHMDPWRLPDGSWLGFVDGAGTLN